MKPFAVLAAFSAPLTLAACLGAALAPSMAAAQPAPAAAAPATLAPKDARFLKKAIMGDDAEIKFGELAEKRGPAVRDFGVMLVQDHTQARDQATALATSGGLAPLSGLSPAASREYAKLSGLGGPQFDIEFTRYMIKDHRKDIAEFRKEAKGEGPVADLARSTLPVLQKHLKAAIGLSQQGS
jgi:putative membrane protein